MLSIALRNVWRQRARAAMTMGAVAFGVAGLILSGGFIQDMFAKLADVIIRSQTGHVQIAVAGYFTQGSRSPEKALIEGSDALSRDISRVEGVTGVTRRLRFSGLLNNRHTDLAVVGEGVESSGTPKTDSGVVIVEGRELQPSDRYGLLVGKGVARALGLHVGSSVIAIVSTSGGAMNTLDLEVTGIFQSFSREYDARAVRIPLGAAQELLDTRGVNLLVLSLDRTSRVASVVDQLRSTLQAKGLEVRAWHELNDFYSKTVDLYDRQFGVLRLIILMMVLLSVANSVNMNLFERTAEFGTMRALGNRSRHVLAQILVETTVLGLVGSLIGVAAGMLAAWGISTVGIAMPPPPNSDLGYVAQIRIVPEVVLSAFLVGTIAAVLAGVMPALRAARMPVAEALRQGI